MIIQLVIGLSGKLRGRRRRFFSARRQELPFARRKTGRRDCLARIRPI
jgi:hypothetical protein